MYFFNSDFYNPGTPFRGQFPISEKKDPGAVQDIGPGRACPYGGYGRNT